MINSKNVSAHNVGPYKVCIVIPTYNEAGNILSLFKEIFQEERKKAKMLKVDLHILVVDDNSPDGTSKIVKDYMKKNKRVHILLRKNKEGLGAAYIAGMKYALKEIKPDILFEMDADHSHNPKDIFRMIPEVQNGVDFLIGSRYVKGGRVPDNWGAHRKVLSFFASNIPRLMLGLRNVKDCSGGFRAMKAEVLTTIGLDSLKVNGYAFQIALLEAVNHEKFVIKEIPITFEERTSGNSKMKFKDLLEGWVVIFRIKMKRTFQYFEPKKIKLNETANSKIKEI